MKATYDKTADAMYLYAHNGKVAKTVAMTEQLIVDFDKKGNILGIEILDASSLLGRNKRIPSSIKFSILGAVK